MAEVSPPPSPRLFLIDGYALIYRAFFAMISRPLTTSKGENTSAAWGVVTFLQRLCANQLDVAWLAPFAYVLAHQKFGADVILSSVRSGSKTYRAQVIVPVDSPIKDVKELRGKKFAFVDSASASGFLYPSALLKDNGIDPKRDLVILEGPMDDLDHAALRHRYGGKLGIDATEKGPLDDVGQPWPEEIRMTDEIRALVTRRWKDYGL